MMNNLTFDKMWNELKEENGQDELFEVAENISDIIESMVDERINKGWTQRDLAKRVGIKQSAIARMERLQAMPRLDTIVKIAQKLGLKISANSTSSKNITTVVYYNMGFMGICDGVYSNMTKVIGEN